MWPRAVATLSHHACLQPLRFSLPRGSYGFATNAFTVPSRGATPEQSVFVVGLNSGKFFGQDSAEEALKMVERVANHGPEYTLLFGISDQRLAEMERENEVKQGRLTPSRQLEGRLHAEMVPVMQAGMVDKRPRKSVGRSTFTDQAHVAYMLWNRPREARKLYWAVWRRNLYKDAEARKFWSKHFPDSSYCLYEERAHIIAIRATEHVMALRKQGLGNSTVLVVNNDIYDLVIKYLGDYLSKDAPEKFESQDFIRKLRVTAENLCQDTVDLTALLVFVYAVMPLVVLQWFVQGGHYYLKQSGALEQWYMNIFGDQEKRL